MLFVVQQYMVFQYFSSVWHPFSDVLTYFVICVWFIPFSFFVSLSASEGGLPTTSTEGVCAKSVLWTRVEPLVYSVRTLERALGVFQHRDLRSHHRAICRLVFRLRALSSSSVLLTLARIFLASCTRRELTYFPCGLSSLANTDFSSYRADGVQAAKKERMGVLSFLRGLLRKKDDFLPMQSLSLIHI